MKTRVVQKPLTYLKFKGNKLEQMSWFPKVQSLTNRNQNQPVESCQNKLADTLCIKGSIKTTNTIKFNTTSWHESWEGRVTRQPLQHEDDKTDFQTPILSNAGRKPWTFSTLKHVLVLTGTVDNCKSMDEKEKNKRQLTRCFARSNQHEDKKNCRGREKRGREIDVLQWYHRLFVKFISNWVFNVHKYDW